jgi:FkbM family methyltransferase
VIERQLPVHLTSMKKFLKSLPLIGPVLSKLRWTYHDWRFNPASRLRSSLRDRKDLYIVQIGSNDGTTSDPIHSLLQSNPSWKAILVEPVPFLFNRLRQNYSNNPNIQFANVAITDQVGKATFYYVDPTAKNHIPELPDWYDQLGSFDPSHIAKHFGNALDPFTVSTQIATFPLSAFLERNNVAKIDLLHIDTEGHDWIVLRQLDLSRFRPDVILIEHKHLSKEDKSETLAFLKREYIISDLGADFFAKARQKKNSQGAHGGWAGKSRL